MSNKLTIHLNRLEATENSTIGNISVNFETAKDFECFSLEDVVREEKIKHETAIPEGTYQVIITRSNRFKKDLPLLLDVPNYEGVRIHPGNTKADTSGCILPGTSQKKDFVGGSRVAFKQLFQIIKDHIDSGGEVFITIRNLFLGEGTMAKKKKADDSASEEQPSIEAKVQAKPAKAATEEKPLQDQEHRKTRSNRPSGYDARVYNLQNALISCGANLPEHGPDGIYGDETESAMKTLAKNWS